MSDYDSFSPEALRELIERSGLRYKQTSISYIFNCPRCNKKDKLYIRKRDGRFVCFVCKETDNFKGRAEWALRELMGGDVKEIQRKLYDGVDIEVLTRHEGRLQIKLLTPKLYQGFWASDDDEDEFNEAQGPFETMWPPDYADPSKKTFAKAQDYLGKRGIPEDLIKEYDIRYSPREKRVAFPVKRQGKLYGWQGRYIEATQIEQPDGSTYHIPKALSTKGLLGGSLLMFEDRLQGSEHCVLAEGPVDALKAHLCGGNVAAMGKGVTQAQLETIRSYGIKKLYIALDRDAGAEVSKIATAMDDIDCYRLLPPDHRQDLGDCTMEEVYQAFREAPRFMPGQLSYFCAIPKRYC